MSALLAISMAASGCSFLFTTSPPATPERLPPGVPVPVTCTTSRAAPIIDTVIGGLEVIRTGIALNNSESDYHDQPISRGADIGFGVALSALFVTSAIYGFGVTGRCDEAKERQMQYSAPYPPGAYPPGAYPPQPGAYPARAADEAQAERARSEGYRQLDAHIEAIRRSPTVPELGATVAEIRAICTQQRGEFVTVSSRVGCRIRSQVIFACTLDDESRTDRCDGFYEGADLVASRKATEAKLGLPVRESVSADGFRVFEWANGAETVIITMYARGVRITHEK